MFKSVANPYRGTLSTMRDSLHLATYGQKPILDNIYNLFRALVYATDKIGIRGLHDERYYKR